MSPERFASVTGRYPSLRVAVAGDFCLDRYYEIDPALGEVSIETGRPVHNVVNVRAQPGGAGTVVANLAALGVGTIDVIGFCGDDGEGFELRRALGRLPGVALDRFVTAPDRRTFTYGKPLVMEPGSPPVELDRLDSKNWTPTPEALQARLAAALREAARGADAIILLEQVDRDETGVLTAVVRAAAGAVAVERPGLPILADSRRGLRDWPAVSYKMNGAELAAYVEAPAAPGVVEARAWAAALAARVGRPAFVTLSERGLVAAAPDGATEHVPALPLRGPIDVVGAGDAVTANLAAALAAGATPREALLLAAVASSVVLHKLGTTGTATVAELAGLLPLAPP
jgi:rfaE bifunctional protein kinase chain/domain